MPHQAPGASHLLFMQAWTPHCRSKLSSPYGLCLSDTGTPSAGKPVGVGQQPGVQRSGGNDSLWNIMFTHHIRALQISSPSFETQRPCSLRELSCPTRVAVAS